MVAVRVFPLEMQKRIVNEAIILKKFDLLLYYCLGYLLAVAAASALKYLSIVIQTSISQRAMADMRNNLYSHIIRLPLDFFRKTSSSGGYWRSSSARISSLQVASQTAGHTHCHRGAARFFPAPVRFRHLLPTPPDDETAQGLDAQFRRPR